MKAIFVLLFACTMAPAPGTAAAPQEDSSIVGSPAGPWRRLFLDSMVVERQAGLERVFHAAQKHPANPVVTADKKVRFFLKNADLFSYLPDPLP